MVPLLALAIWSRDWIGWWSLAAVAAVLAFMMVNPLLWLGEPCSTRSCVKRVRRAYLVRPTRSSCPLQFRASNVPNVTTALQVAGLAVMAYGLVRLDWLAVVSGVLLAQTAAWLLDRMVLLFEDMKARDPAYAAWER